MMTEEEITLVVEDTPTEEDQKIEPEDTNTEDDVFDESLIDPEVRDYKPETPEEEEDLDPEEKERINKIVSKTVGTQVQEMQQQMKVDSFFNQNKEFAKYKAATEKYVKHPLYKNLPVGNIVSIIAGKDMQKIGAAKEREAQRKQAEAANPGSAARKTSTDSFNWLTAPKEDFEKKKAEVLGRQGV